MYLYDAEGRKYLDFAAGIAVCGLGYGHPELTKALKEQAEKLLHTSNLFYNESCGKAAAALKKACGMDRVLEKRNRSIRVYCNGRFFSRAEHGSVVCDRA